jgi:hypothetical protein
MVRHVVVFTWSPEATEEQIAAVVDGLSGLPAQIPQLRDYRFGPDVGVVEGNGDFALVADFDSFADFAAYRDHPAHQAVLGTRILPILAARAAVQYEI